MQLKKININYFYYSLSVAIFLSGITLLVSFLSPITDLRLISVFIYYSFINVISLFGFAFLINFLSKYYRRFSRIFFLYLTSTYFLIYLLSSLNFILTGQTIKAQSVLFIIKINPIHITYLIVLGILLSIALISFIINRLLIFRTASKSEIILSRKILLATLLFFLFFLAFIYPKMGVEVDLVKLYTDGKAVIFPVSPSQGIQIISSSNDFHNYNVVFILLESVSSDRLSFYGYSRNSTPNIDKLAEKSMVFTNTYTTATHSDYAQPAYLSSNYILENKYRNFFSVQKNQNAAWQIFAEEGYSNYYFSSQDDSWAGMGNYFNYSSLDAYWYSLSDNKTDYGSGLGKKDYDETTIDNALAKLNKTFITCISEENQSNSSVCSFEQTKPFFLYLNLQATHDPLSYPSEYSFFTEQSTKEEEKVNKYDNALRYVDIQVGRVLDYLEEYNLINNTIIVLSSDHGHDLYSLHNSYGHGLSIYEDEIRVPLVFYLPGEEQKNISEKVSHIDVLPTTMEILSIEQRAGFRGSPMETNKRLFFYTQNHMYLIGMIEGEIKTIIDLNRNLVEVYNLTKDPLEQNDLSKEGDYDSQVLTLLMWHHCQLNYFSADSKPINLEKYCSVFEN